MRREREPKILIPYRPPEEKGPEATRDFFIVLRPEANGVEVESLLLKVVAGTPLYKKNVSFVYLANIPGDYIVNHRIVEQHYHMKISFARRGTEIFTPFMKKEFESRYGVPLEEAEVLGAFQALKVLNCSEEELFRLRVDRKDMLEINGQSIKRSDGRFIVNYDIPAILHKNSRDTDVAVMIFRSSLEESDFSEMIHEMGEQLVEGGVLKPHVPISRIFHYSKGPLEFLLDCSGYLLKTPQTHFPFRKLGFIRFLHDRGIPMKIIEGVLKYHILSYRSEGGGLVERDIFQYTFGSSFENSYQKLISACGQCYIA